MTEPTANLPGAPAAAPAEPLPGLDPEPTTPRGGTSALEREARRTLRALADDGLLTEKHAGLMELFLTLARSVDRAASAASPRASAVAMAAKEMREVFAMFLPPEEGGGNVDVEFERWLRALNDASS